MSSANGPVVVRVEKSAAEGFMNWFLQTVGVAAAVIFGVWTVLSWDVSKQANVQSDQANAIALAGVCAQLSPDDNVNGENPEDSCAQLS